MWYYELNHEPVGPVSVDTLEQLLNNGTINALTLVWKEGMADWKHLGETELSDLSRNIRPVTPVISPIGIPVAEISSSTNPQPTKSILVQYPRVKLNSLKRLFTWWVTLSGVVAIYQVLGSLFPDSSVMVGISCAAEIIIILYTLMQFLLLYRFWQLIQDGKAGTTPARAIGFLFIPIFNLYWFFRVYFGLDLDLNRYISRHFDNQPGVEVRKAHPLIALVYLLCAFGGGVALYSFIFSKLFTATGSSMNLDAFNTLMIQYTWPLTIYSLASMALAVLMYLDFYLTAKKILETEEKRN